MGKTILSKKCSVIDCGATHYAKGYCQRHRAQILRFGSIKYTGAHMFTPRPAILKKREALIPLGVNAKDGYAIVDLEDAWVAKHKWHLNAYGYASTKVDDKTTLMHRIILAAPEELGVDHINHNTLDNRKKNIRLCDQADNSMNKPPAKRNKLGYKGVYKHQCGKYMAQITYRNKSFYLGLHDTAEEAAKAYNNKATELSKEFAYVNDVV